jgi:hypothetical protein
MFLATHSSCWFELLEVSVENGTDNFERVHGFWVWLEHFREGAQMLAQAQD